MQPPPPTGCTGNAPPPPSPPVAFPSDGGAGAPLDEVLIVLVSGLSAAPTPATAKASTATPPHIAVTVLPLRINTTSNCRFWTRDAHSLTERYGARLTERFWLPTSLLPRFGSESGAI
jgi:hypothetical protein